ncbi:hypothetical protein G6F68_013824 [Rhizopus microsporus]|nr:hypothetical protein G6F31_013801 [Rhizopus arrhizus]KAG1248355.1 hypothetical protein G6F68_013824 [Rhizopus microsporus]
MSPVPAPVDPAQAVQRIRELARAHGFQRCGIAGIELGEDEAHLADWLGQGLYGTMDWMARHGTLRAPTRTTPRPGRPWLIPAAPTWLAMRWAATTTS